MTSQDEVLSSENSSPRDDFSPEENLRWQLRRHTTYETDALLPPSNDETFHTMTTFYFFSLFHCFLSFFLSFFLYYFLSSLLFLFFTFSASVKLWLCSLFLWPAQSMLRVKSKSNVFTCIYLCQRWCRVGARGASLCVVDRLICSQWIFSLNFSCLPKPNTQRDK